MARRLLALTLSLAALAVALTAGHGAAAPSARAAGLVNLEAAIVRELNRVRAAHGLRPLSVAQGLETAAAGHSASMLTTGVFEHASADGTSFGDRIRRTYPARGFRSWTVAENLLYNTGMMSAGAAVEAWLESPPHRANMLSAAFREVGVGAAYTQSARGDFGRGAALVITIDFGARSSG